MAANYDAIISPRFIQHRGFGIEGEFRYLNEWSKSKLSTAFLGNDKGGNNDDDIDPATGLHATKEQIAMETTHRRHAKTLVSLHRL